MYCSIHSFALYIRGSAPRWLIYHTVSQLQWIFSSSLPCHNNIPLHKELNNERYITLQPPCHSVPLLTARARMPQASFAPRLQLWYSSCNIKCATQALGVTQPHLSDCSHSGTILQNTVNFWFCLLYFFQWVAIIQFFLCALAAKRHCLWVLWDLQKLSNSIAYELYGPFNKSTSPFENNARHHFCLW